MITKLITTKAKLDLRKYKKMLNDPMAYQKKILFHILNYNRNTDFGKAHNFNSINDIRTFQERIALGDSKDKREFFERTLVRDNILTHDPVVHWVKTTGTTGNPKILPSTEDGIKKWCDGSSRQFMSFLIDKAGNEKILDGKLFLYVGQSDVDRIRGIPVGYISGIAATRMTSPIIAKRIVPSLEIINNPDWKERLWNCMMCGVAHDVRSLSGVTSVALSFLNKIKDTLPSQIDRIKDSKIQTKVKNAIIGDEVDLNELWPNMKYIASSGVAAEGYRQLVKDLLGDVTILEMYSASEGHLAFQMHEDEPGMYLNFDNYFFEFLDSNEPDKVFLLDEVKVNTPYELVLTTNSGLYRYRIGDIVKFVAMDSPRIVIQGRKGNVLNLCSEKVTEDQLGFTITQTMKELGNYPTDYILSGTQALPLRHKLFIELQALPKNLDKHSKLMSEIVDQILQKTNSSYHLSRGQKVLETPEVHILKKGTFDLIHSKIAEKTGQVGHSKILHILQPKKIDKVIDEEMVLFSYIPSDYSSNK